MKQTIEIEVPDGKKAVWKDGKVMFEDIKPQLPKTWEEFCKQNTVQIGECYFDENCNLIEINVCGDRHNIIDTNILPSKQAAEAHLALMQLHQLRDTWREGWLPDWTEDNQRKYVIFNLEGEFEIRDYYTASGFLAFQDKKRAEEFKDCFIDLIRKAGDLI